MAVSALLTTTMPAMKDTVDALNASSRRTDFKILVGGAPITQDFANQIKADSYAPDAASAAKAAKALI
jgi:5-methyltetrahydrofolate--homocysteine methyltransferase